MIANYLNSVIKQFEYYKAIGDKTFVQLDEVDFQLRLDSDSNSIAIIVNHLWGNMMSRWTNFLTEDGEKEWRKRDLEFEEQIKTKEQLVKKWEQGWMCLFEGLNGLTSSNFDQPIYIRNQKHSIIEAINRQMTHYAYHLGQIVVIAKHIKGAGWNSLSILKDASSDFNSDKFQKGKHGGHYTDDIK
jgi:hypothetical protein